MIEDSVLPVFSNNNLQNTTYKKDIKHLLFF